MADLLWKQMKSEYYVFYKGISMLNRFRFTTLILFACLVSRPIVAQDQTLNDPGSLTKYVTVKLEADLSHLSDNQRKMIPLLIEAGEQMDNAFWKQAYGNQKKLVMPEDVGQDVAKALMEHATAGERRLRRCPPVC